MARKSQLRATVRPQVPACPRCGGDTVLRRSQYGEFFGCANYPICNGIVGLQQAGESGREAARILRHCNGESPLQREPAPASPSTSVIRKAPGSLEQERIWREILHGDTHLVVEAVAGSGKTWTMIQACLRLVSQSALRVAFVAFNKHIAVEAGGKLQAAGCVNTTCGTYHSFGLRCVRAMFPNTQVNQNKVDDLMSRYPVATTMPPYQWRAIKTLTGKLVGFAKNYLLNEESADFRAQLEHIADHHAIDLTGYVGQRALDFSMTVLADSRKEAHVSVDFDDMIWLPVVLNLRPATTFDVLIVDEAQDTNLCQQELALRLCPTGRVIIVGDRYQSIYGFRGADITAISSLTDRLGGTARGVRTLTLSVTRRCPKSHVKLAQAIVPTIQAMESATEGVVPVLPETEALGVMVPGDLVLCRCNAPLISAAYTLLRRGVKAIIRGRDIGQGLLALVEKLEAAAGGSLLVLASTLQEYRYCELTRLLPLGEKAAGRIGALNDRCDCLRELIAGVDSVTDLKARIAALFADFEADGRPREAVVLGTVHRTKGLEAERVFILRTDLIPHPAARRDWEHLQERNLAYVAVTRAKYSRTGAPGTLVFCGPIPLVYEQRGVNC